MNQNSLFICLTILSFLICTVLPLLEKRKNGQTAMHPLGRKLHPVFAVLFLIFSFIHGILAGNKPGMLTGKAAWFCLLILIICSLLKKYIPQSRRIHIHRILSILLILLILLHVICVTAAG